MENNDSNPDNYNYPVKNNLIKDVSSFADKDEFMNIFLCVYKINTSGKFPFLQFLLSNSSRNTLGLPNLPSYSSFNKINLLSYSKVFLSGILQIENFDNFITTLEFDGFYEFSNNLYIFYDVTKCEINIDDTYSYNPVRFALTDEIINHRSICEMVIDYDTCMFFLNNPFINYIYNDKNDVFEIPIIGYVGKSTTERLNFVYTFGESAKNKSAILGPYFYFTDFKNAIRQGGWSHNYKPEYSHGKLITDNDVGRYAKGGIVRFALFIGNTKYIENMPNDTVDDSEVKKQRINDDTLDRSYEILTSRISDHDGMWSNIYNSAYLNKIELDNGSFLKETPIIVIKEYNQQIPLSYHYIDKSKLGENFDLNNYSYRIV